MSKFVVTDKTIYRTTCWVVKHGDVKYFVQCQEGDMYNTWYIEDIDTKNIDPESQLGHDLIVTCEIYEDWNMDSDERFDDEYNTDPNLTMYINDKEWDKEMGRNNDDDKVIQ